MSNTTKHTPGPWKFCIAFEPERGEVPPDYSGHGFCDNPAIYGAEDTFIVGCDEYDVFDNPDDTRLILAAPELLEALKYARRFLNQNDHDVAYVDAAIAKATGEQQ